MSRHPESTSHAATVGRGEHAARTATVGRGEHAARTATIGRAEHAARHAHAGRGRSLRAFTSGARRAENEWVRRLAPLLLTLPLLACGVAFAGTSGNVPGSACPLFPADNVWHADVSRLPVHARSGAWLASASASTRRLHPDFGPSGDAATPYGIPFHVVPSSHAKVDVTFDYADESDRVPYPFGSDTPIEGGAGSGGDMHAIVVDSGTCRLYETWHTQHGASGWTAGSGATWDLRSNAQRPDTWTSADAAGLPILPGLLRLDEVQAGHVDHAIRFTVNRTDRTYVWPARHQAGAARDPNLPPMGARFRLKASYDTAGLRADTRAVLAAMKTYGMVLADNGSDWFFQGDAQNGWPSALLDQLKAVPASAFEAVDASSLMVSAGSAQAKGAGPSPVFTHWSTPSPVLTVRTTRNPVATKPPPARRPTPLATTATAPAPAGTTLPATTPPATTPSTRPTSVRIDDGVGGSRRDYRAAAGLLAVTVAAGAGAALWQRRRVSR
jgi:hypothetical protein